MLIGNSHTRHIYPYFGWLKRSIPTLSGLAESPKRSTSELYGANAKLGLALQDNLAIYGLAGLFAVEGDGVSSDDGVSYGAGITYAVTETFQVVGEASFTEFSGLDKISAKAGAIYSFDL